MPHVCTRCQRVNPQEARYCFWDGAMLAGAAAGGPINPGQAAFPHPFVFPNGQACQNFDQLATACQQQWPAAIQLLKQGYLASFLGGMGRLDLSTAAQDAAQFPDPDRGLDQFLARLPTHALPPPVLKVEPTSVNLGVLPMGTDRELVLNLQNAGKRLVYGSVVSDSKWLVVGEGTGPKIFQFGADTIIPVHVRGHYLRAGNKPLEGQLLVESNGGSITVTVRCEVPANPFPEGFFRGATTPRQIAEKAKVQPVEAAPMFESGAISRWFAGNGWTYPVQGPTVPGVGGVQQFFEALGLAKAPKVELKTKRLDLKGDGGDHLQASIEVVTPEKKVVWAYATCDQFWVEVGKWKAGKAAVINVNIPRVPNKPHQTITANIHVTGNGNQKFTVPLSVAVGAPSPYGDEMPLPAAPMQMQAVPMDASMARAAIPIPIPVDEGAFGFGGQPMAAVAVPATAGTAKETVAVVPAPAARASWRPKPWMTHGIPLALLALVLLGLLIRDLVGTPPAIADETDVDRTPRLAVLFDWGPAELGFGNTMQFGVVTVKEKAETAAGSKKIYEPDQRLIYHPNGRSNSAVALVDGKELVFGTEGGASAWETVPKTGAEAERLMDLGQELAGTWRVNDAKVFITQKVKVIAGEPLPVDAAEKDFKRRLDTVLVHYTLENRDSSAHKVGFRIVLDTLIGANDGTPFTIPGDKSLIDDKLSLEDGKVPDFIQAQEFTDMTKPGTIVRLNLNLGKEVEVPGKVLLTRWPGHPDAGSKLANWDVNLVSMKNPLVRADLQNDSAVALYWLPKDLPAGGKRELGFTYGLGNLATSGAIGISVGGSFTPGGSISIVAQVSGDKSGRTATIVLPPQLSLIEGEKTQPVPEPFKEADGKLRPNPITWRIQAGSEVVGTFPITVETSDGQTQRKYVRISGTGIF